MVFELLTKQINDTADKWIAVLSHYDLDILLKQPDIQKWSLGQVAMHIITENDFYTEQVEYCLTSNENISEQMVPQARTMFVLNSFPDIQIERDASLSQSYPQPKTKSNLLEEMEKSRMKLISFIPKIKTSDYNGKTRHPG
jgi:hypothetical protein